MKRYGLRSLICFSLCLALFACASRDSRVQTSLPPTQKKHLANMGYMIQAGAFANAPNAVRLTNKLQSQGLDATYFKAADGLFKVRFGNFSSRKQAGLRAQSLQSARVIEEYYIVAPEDYPVAKQQQYGTDYLRESLVKSARDFIGVPYLWGGTSARTGFDCSGLAMTVYQLNGLDLPRHSATQYEAGESVSRGNLQKGDLVFFALSSRGKVSHVGIYIGGGHFVHAPSRGKTIRIDNLSDGYYGRRYVGAKSYL
ncbi:MAG: NlpC/P60 family protein [Smithellaceae bacterium]